VGRKRRRGPETGGKRQKRNETHRHKNDRSSGDEGESDKERVSACIPHVSSAITRLPRTFLPPTMPPSALLAARILEASAVRGINIPATRISADHCRLSL